MEQAKAMCATCDLIKQSLIRLAYINSPEYTKYLTDKYDEPMALVNEVRKSLQERRNRVSSEVNVVLDVPVVL